MDTDDLVQVTLIKALAHLHEFEPEREGAFLAYLRRILLNQPPRRAAAGAGFSPAGAAIVYLLGAVAAFVLIDDLWPVAWLFVYAPVHMAQDLANQVNARRAPASDRNEALSILNKVTLALGGLLFCLGLLGSFTSIRERARGAADPHTGTDQVRGFEANMARPPMAEPERPAGLCGPAAVSSPR